MNIGLTEILKFDNPEEYKVHLANYNGEHQPLDVFVRSKEEWKGWNSWRGEKDDFNRKYIFSLIEFYPESNTWLFGGVFEVLERFDVTRDFGYEVRLTDIFENYIGRLKIHWVRSGRTKSRKFENCIDDFTVVELLREEYTGEVFCGYENINHNFSTLEYIFSIDKPDWKSSLENIKGVYLIMDKSNGKKYVGSAYGTSGIWFRWSCYMNNGHGGNDELTSLIKKKGMDYARENFVISLLEYRSMKTDDKTIIDRETYWKEVLLSRGKFGYNKN